MTPARRDRDFPLPGVMLLKRRVHRGEMTSVSGRFRLNEPQVTAKVMDGEAVIIHLGTGVYYSMDGAGCAVWEGIVAGHDAGAVIDGIVGRYGVDRPTVAEDVRRLLDELVAAELLAPADGIAPAGAIFAPSSTGPYESPALKRYDDMAELLALDPPLPAAPR